MNFFCGKDDHIRKKEQINNYWGILTSESHLSGANIVGPERRHWEGYIFLFEDWICCSARLAHNTYGTSFMRLTRKIPLIFYEEDDQNGSTAIDAAPRRDRWRNRPAHAVVQRKCDVSSGAESTWLLVLHYNLILRAVVLNWQKYSCSERQAKNIHDTCNDLRAFLTRVSLPPRSCRSYLAS